jgi:nucleoside-diphosphate-sugar epimerase
LLTNSIYFTGASGFVGSNLIKFFKYEYKIIVFQRDLPIVIDETFVIHLAGKALDLKNVSNPDEYYQVNTELTKKVFDAFLSSSAKVFITLSSVKAVADDVDGLLVEEHIPNPITHYGKSKLLAEEYILSKQIPPGKRVYILRPCLIHGPDNRGNLNLLFQLVTKGLPWPLGAFENSRSFCSIDNLMFVLKELIERDDIPSGVYNVADDEPISTNDLIALIAQSQNKKPKIWKVSKGFINFIAKIGDKLHLPINSERLQKLTDSYVVSNAKLKNAIGKKLPFSTREGLLHTFLSFKR